MARVIVVLNEFKIERPSDRESSVRNEREIPMRLKIVTMIAAAALLSACTNQQAGTANNGGTGGAAVDQGVQVKAPTPGSQEDLVVKVGDRVFFGFDKADLTAGSQLTLKMQAAWLSAYPGSKVVIEGHADERGTREYNLALGDRRANAVRNYLLSLNVNPNQVTTISYGKERPVALGSNENSWAQNRRAVTTVQ